MQVVKSMNDYTPSALVSAILLMGLFIACGLFVHTGSQRLGAVESGELQAKKDILGHIKDPKLADVASQVTPRVSHSDCWQRERVVVLRQAAMEGLFWATGESQQVLHSRAEGAFKKCYAIHLFEMRRRKNNPATDGLLSALHTSPRPVSLIEH